MEDAEVVLRRAPLFDGLDEESARALRRQMSEVKLSRGEHLFLEGQDGDRLYVVLDGKLKLTRAAADGRENLLSVLGPGEMFGELSLFDPGPRTATATVVTEARLASLAHTSLRPWITNRPEIAEQLLRVLARRRMVSSRPARLPGRALAARLRCASYRARLRCASYRARLRRRSVSRMSTERAEICSQPRAAKSASALLTVSRDAPTSWASSS